MIQFKRSVEIYFIFVWWVGGGGVFDFLLHSYVVLLCNSVDSISEGRKFLKAQIDGDSSLFYAQIPGGTILLHHVEEKEKFPAQFGREVAF